MSELNKKNYKYDAFISYRHCERDKFVAETLHKMIETYRLPAKAARKAGGRDRVKRIFRDKDELPLTSNLQDPIMEAIADSEYLIVICTPRLRESLWCQKEIDTFISQHGVDKVLAVLAEGEPSESFPEQLLYREETVIGPEGRPVTIRRPMEPLAADCRGETERDVKKAMKTEMLRLLAPIFGVGFDDLKQRQHERKMRRIVTGAIVGSCISLAVGAASFATALVINGQKQQIKQQADEISAQYDAISQLNDEITAQNEEITAQNEILIGNQARNLAQESANLLAMGRRKEAVLTAIDALTEYEGIEMPYTPEAELALANSLHVYDNGYSYKALSQLKLDGHLEEYHISHSKRYLATVDNLKRLVLWDLETQERIVERTLDRIGTSEMNFGFIGDRYLAYRSDSSFYLVDLSTREDTARFDAPYGYGFFADPEGKTFAIGYDDKLQIFDTDSLRTVKTVEVASNQKTNWTVYYDTSSEYLAYEIIKDKDEYYAGRTQRELHVLRISDLEEVFSMDIEGLSLQKLIKDGDFFYMAMNEMNLTLTDLNAVLWKTDLKGNTVWKREIPRAFNTFTIMPVVEEGEHILFCSSMDAFLINKNNGAIEETFSAASSIVGGGAYKAIDYFVYMTSSGSYYYINVPKLLSYELIGKFQTCDNQIKAFEVTPYGFVLIPLHDDRVTLYDGSLGAGMEQIDRDVEELSQLDSISYYNAVEIAQGYGIERAALVNYLFYNEDESVVFFNFVDNKLEAYRTSDMEKLFEMDDVQSAQYAYLGTDRNGHHYIVGVSFGYILDENYQTIAVVEGLADMDPEANLIYVKNADTVYQCPIYTTQELLEMGRDFVVK